MTGGALQLLPGTVCKVVMACCVLHNRAVNARLAVEAEEEPEDRVDPVGADAAAANDDQDIGEGVRMREAVIRNVFA